ncbi:hypothetical protein DYBT9275_04777 [Dyadobacter sp. CECT 9275]|uniref:Uncharacterized protein n=1 Tax=Dyadobacter helix TaxID=2822344 RepID=A0A916JGL2_9BACT|nr:hypothetical protein DYBT9275_04777 [Dyadobacter sp. CECT 9275]
MKMNVQIKLTGGIERLNLYSGKAYLKVKVRLKLDTVIFKLF